MTRSRRPPRRRGVGKPLLAVGTIGALALIGGEYRLGNAIGPVIGGLVAATVGYPATFAAFGLLSVIVVAMVGLWAPPALTLAALRPMAWFQNPTVVPKFPPLPLVGLVGCFFVSAGNLGALTPPARSLDNSVAIAAAAAMACSSFLLLL